MTKAFEQGFVSKIAEFGVKEADAKVLASNYLPEILGGMLLGGATGALADKKKRLRGAIIGALLGGTAGGTLRHALAGKEIKSVNRYANSRNKYKDWIKKNKPEGFAYSEETDPILGHERLPIFPRSKKYGTKAQRELALKLLENGAKSFDDIVAENPKSYGEHWDRQMDKIEGQYEGQPFGLLRAAFDSFGS